MLKMNSFFCAFSMPAAPISVPFAQLQNLNTLTQKAWHFWRKLGASLKAIDMHDPFTGIHRTFI
jgi:hypothetical protein